MDELIKEIEYQISELQKDNDEFIAGTTTTAMIKTLQWVLAKIKNLGEGEAGTGYALLGEVLADIKESIESDKSSLNNLYGNNALMNKAYFRSLMIVEKCIGKHLA